VFRNRDAQRLTALGVVVFGLVARGRGTSRTGARRGAQGTAGFRELRDVPRRRRHARARGGHAAPYDTASLRASPHAGLECAACHTDLADVKDFPHPTKLAKVECGNCHASEHAEFAQSIHGVAASHG
jgi:hypothetical protein